MNLKKHTLLVFVIAVVSLFSIETQAQTEMKPLTRVVYNENVKEPLTNRELSQIKEVYGDYTSKILEHPQRLKDIKNILRNRVVIMKVENKDLSSFENLSSVPLFNPYNLNVTRDVTYNPNTFNPLKYQFNFHSRQKDKFYRFDNTPYLIIIKSQYSQ